MHPSGYVHAITVCNNQPPACISSLAAFSVAIDKTLTKANSNGEDDFSTRESIEELCELCGTAGLSVSGSCIQRLSLPNPKTFLNAGDRIIKRTISMSALA